MSATQNHTRKATINLDKLDEMLESIEKATALAEVACSSRIGELNEITIFRYFSTLADMLGKIKTLFAEAQK